VLPGHLRADGGAVVCPTSTASIPAGRHVVRLSLNGQQFSPASPAPLAETISFHAAGPTLKMRRKVTACRAGVANHTRNLQLGTWNPKPGTPIPKP
jgi:hypothetical protein